MSTSALKSYILWRKQLLGAAVCTVFFVFSFWLMFKTFSYDPEKHVLLVSPKIWSDFAANLPLIRSFSFGDNWPPEYPIFPGLPIQYHFLFYFFVGKLEQIGIPLHWALNIPSAIGFFGILAGTFAIAKRLFNDNRVAVLSVIFFLFNGSLSFIQFLQKHLSNNKPLSDIFSTTQFSAMGPWDGGTVLGVWHLNVFINQRHFCVALGLLISFIFVCLWLENRSKHITATFATIFGIFIGFLPLFHKPVMLMFAITMTAFFFLMPYLRLFLILTGTIASAILVSLWLMSFNIAGPAQDSISWYPGFTMHGAQSPFLVVGFLWQQFGLHCILAPIGFLIAPAPAKKVIVPAVIVFLLAFLFRFSPDVMANHKFINFSLIFFQMLSAFVVVFIYDRVSNATEKWMPANRRISAFASQVLSISLVSVLTLSGIIDFLAIFNDSYAGISDVGADERATWFYESTPKNAVVLNSSFLYHPASIAGRKVFVGWPYFTTTAGYDHEHRFGLVKAIYAGEDRDHICTLLRDNNITHLTVEDTSGNKDLPHVNIHYFYDNFTPLYVSSNKMFAVFSVASICPKW